MARSRGSSSRSSSSRASAPPPPPKNTNVPAQTQSYPVGQPQVQRAPGFVSQVASVAMGSAAGHVIGRGISDTLFGGRGESSAPVQQDNQQYSSMGYDQPQSNPCEPDAKAFARCLESNGSDLSKCQIYFDMLNQCRAQFSNEAKW